MPAPVTSAQEGASPRDEVAGPAEAARASASVGASRIGRSATRRPALFLFLFLFGVYALLAGGHAYSSDEEGYFQQSQAMLHGTYAFDLTPDNNVVTAARGGRDGRTTGGGGIGAPVVALPLLAVGTAVAHLAPDAQAGVVERLFVGFTNSWITALIGVVIFLAAMELGAPRNRAILLALVYGLGTMALPHAKTLLFSEPLTALGTTAAVLFALRAVSRVSWVDAALAGACAGVAIAGRPSAAPFALVIGVYVLAWGWRRNGVRRAALPVGAYVLAVAAMLALIGLANWWRYGSASESGYGAVPLDFSPVEGLYGLLLSPGKSLFLYAPIALVAVAAAIPALRRRPAEVVLLGAIVLGNLAIFARFFQWHGDQAWGPRYLQITLPALVLIVAPVLAGGRRWTKAVLVAGMLGAVVSWSGSVMYFNQYYYRAEHEIGVGIEEGEPAYWKDVHFDPAWSPVLGHLKLIGDVAQNTADRIDGVDESFARFGTFPTSTNGRYGWYFAPPQLDTWWYWAFPQDTTKLVLLLLPFLVASAGFGLRGLRREALAA